MFKRQKKETGEPEAVAPPNHGSAPAEPAEPGEPGPIEVSERTTVYPQDDGAPPPVLGVPRTTVYRQAIPWSRRGYDTVN
jgi:hypothetical protein